MSADPETNELASGGEDGENGENEEDDFGSISSGSLEPPPDTETENNQVRDRTDLPEQQTRITNVDSRLLRAQQSYEPDDRLRSKDLVPVTAKFNAFRAHLNTLMPLIKTFQGANRDMQKARTKMCQDIASMSVESPVYENVGKMLDSDKISSGTAEEAMEHAAKSGTKSLVSVNQLALVPQKAMESVYHESLVDYVYEWEHVVANKVDKLMEPTTRLGRDRQHYETKVDRMREEKTQAESKGKEFPPKKKERLERNERKLKDSIQIHEEKASEFCHLLEQIVDYGWQDLLPLVENTVKWEYRRYENDAATFGTLLLPVLGSLEKEISRLEAEEDAEDLEAALTLQREKNQVLQKKLDKLKVALTGKWETKNELFRTFSLA